MKKKKHYLFSSKCKTDRQKVLNITMLKIVIVDLFYIFYEMLVSIAQCYCFHSFSWENHLVSNVVKLNLGANT